MSPISKKNLLKKEEKIQEGGLGQNPQKTKKQQKNKKKQNKKKKQQTEISL